MFPCHARAHDPNTGKYPELSGWRSLTNVSLPTKLIMKSNDLIKVMHFKGGRGVRSYGFRSWKLSLIIYLADRGGYDGHLSEKFVKILFLARVIRIAVIVSQFGCHQCVH